MSDRALMFSDNKNKNYFQEESSFLLTKNGLDLYRVLFSWVKYAPENQVLDMANGTPGNKNLEVDIFYEAYGAKTAA